VHPICLILLSVTSSVQILFIFSVEKSKGLCYDKCADGYQDQSLGLCSQACPAGSKDFGVGCIREAYNRGAGTLPFSIYVKERLIPYGKKDK
jgi:hypothetical protein